MYLNTSVFLYYLERKRLLKTFLKMAGRQVGILRDRTAVHMIQKTHTKAAGIQSAVTEANLATNISLSATPRQFRGTYTQIIPDEGMAPEDFYKHLLKLSTSEESGYLTSLSVGSVLLGVATPVYYWT